MATMENFCGSVFWDWNLTWYTENPDFTPCFERTVVTFIPCLFLWVFATVDLLNSYWSPSLNAIPWSVLNIAKFLLTATLILIEASTILISWIIPLNSENFYVVYPVDLYMPIFRAITLLLYLVLLIYSKNHGVRSSVVQFIFWLLFSISQAIRFRTVLIQSQQQQTLQNYTVFILEVVYFPVVLGEFILNCWADVAPAYQQSASTQNISKPSSVSPEISCSVLSKILFEWFTPLTWKGYRKPLEFSDLWEPHPDISCCNAVPRFDYYWPTNLNVIQTETHSKAKNSKKVSPKQKMYGSVFVTCAKAFGLKYLFGFSIRIVAELLVFVSPQILNLLITFVGTPNEPTWKGIFYALVLLTNAAVVCLFAANGIHIFYQVACSMKSALVSAVYRKSLLLSNSAKREQSSGEILNRMSCDISYVSDFMQGANFLITFPLVVSIALYFLWGILGVATLAGVAVMIILIPLTGLVASQVQKLHKQQMAYKDQRTKLVNEILSGMKIVKLYAWEPSFLRLVGNIRQKELTVLRKIAYWNSLANFLSSCAPFMVAIGSFGTFVLIDSENVLDAKTAFVSLSLFNIINQPLTILPFIISSGIQASVGLKRLNDFMNSEEIDLDGVSHDPSEENPVVIKNGSFAWEANSKTGNTLENINLEVKDGQLIAIVGPVGSGKSSLLSVLLNELVKIEGKVNVRGSIAYVAQTAWIQNATVRDNILFGKPYDPTKYKKIIEACALLPDLEMLPSGDKTEIGEKGINISGGQKARLSLARAVYSNADIFLLDDPLSAVDAHVGKHIFTKVIGPKGLLRKKTRLLVTHGIVHLPEMHNILVMNNGRITETGSYSQLQEKQGLFAEFLKTHSASETQPNSEDLALARKLSRAVSESESETTPLHTATSTCSISSQETTKNQLITQERPETQSVKASVYISYFRSAGWLFTLGTLLMYFIFQSFSVGANLWLSQWTDNPVPTENSFYLGIYGLLGFLQAVSILIASCVMALGNLRSANVIHENSLSSILLAPLQFFDVTPTGRILNRFSKDVDSLDNILPIFLRFFLNGVFNVLAVIVVISLSTPVFTAVVLPMALAYFVVQRFFICTSRQLKRLESVSKSPIYSHFGETIQGASTIRAYGHQERFIQELESRQDQNIVSFYYLQCSNRWLHIRLELMGNTVVFFAALFAVLGRDSLSEGLVGLSVSYALQITMALIFVVRFTSDVENNIVAVERLNEYRDCPKEKPWKQEMGKLKGEWPREGKIEFDRYKTRYRPGLDLVLRGISFGVNAGEKVGVVGRTGAGKSSVTLALFRIVEAAEGRILVDGEDISRFGLHDVRGNITIIPQEPMLFSGTMKVNLDPFEEKRDDELWRALELAHLKDFVRELPGGLEYEIAEGGENLSVGQRQLVCLARALLRKTKILVLDEATSAVDLDTEELILKTIREEFRDATVITIAHRLNTIMDSDRVLVLEDGEVLEYDKPTNLLETCGSAFYSMAKEAGLVNTSSKLET